MASNTEYEMDDMMESAIPLTDEELEAAAGDSTVYVFDDGGARQKKRKKMAYLCVIGTLTVLLVAAIILAGELFHEKKELSNNDSPPAPEQAADIKDAVWLELRDNVLSSMDKSANPCEDFYQYACGGWIEAHRDLDPSEPSVSRTFSSIADENDIILRQIMEDGWPIISPLYRSCMDTDALDRLGLEPIEGFTSMIYESTPQDLTVTLAALHSVGFGGLFSFGVGADFHDPDKQIMEIDQGGLGMGRSYYSDEDEQSQAIRAAYTEFMRSTLARVWSRSSGSAEVGGRVQAIFDVERYLAENSMSVVDRRNPENLYHEYDASTLQQLIPSLDVVTYLQAMGIPQRARKINVVDVDFFTALDALLNSTDHSVLQDYLMWRVVEGSASKLDSPMRDALFEFVKHLTGRTEEPERWKTCTSTVNGLVGELVGRYFVMERFSGNSKVLAKKLLETIRLSFEDNLPNVPWMDNDTRIKALAKLNAMGEKIGYPDVWENYDDLVVYSGRWFASVLAVYEFEISKEMAGAGGPTDKEEWSMDPQTVNAQYSPLRNEMLFPAAILQPPVFHKDFPTAVNWGGMGVIMGHELTHGFDDEGRQFNKDGKLEQWWSNEAVAAFDQEAQCVVELYDGFEVEASPPTVNGAQTEGENIADMGGLKESFRAFQQLKTHRDFSEDIKHSERYFGMTAEQLFFLSYGQVWCSVATEERARLLLNVDVHSPAKARVNLPLKSFDAFAQAYQCPPESYMNPAQRCSVW